MKGTTDKWFRLLRFSALKILMELSMEICYFGTSFVEVFCASFRVSFAFLIVATFFSIKCELMASTSIKKQGNWCRCLDSEEAKNVSSSGKPHVHCSCLLCKGKAVYPMTAWRHLQRANRARNETSGTCESGQSSTSRDLKYFV